MIAFHFLLFAVYIARQAKTQFEVVLFGVVFFALTMFLGWKTEMIQRFPDVRVNHEFRGLLLGIVLICGISAACLPLLYNSRKFSEFAL